VPTQPAVFQCLDGGYVYYALVLSDLKPWQQLVEWMESHDLALDLTDPAYLQLQHRQDNFPYIQGILESFFALLDSHTAYHEAQARGLPVGVLNAPEDLFHDEHLQAREFFVTIEQPGFGDVTFPGVPYRLSAFDAAPPAPAARLGQHTDEVLGSPLTKGAS
jgi:crotonobetainyl-CoA:carnitine CoA-transferase CaiB-like acyl-CoA transferase